MNGCFHISQAFSGASNPSKLCTVCRLQCRPGHAVEIGLVRVLFGRKTGTRRGELVVWLPRWMVTFFTESDATLAKEAR